MVEIWCLNVKLTSLLLFEEYFHKLPEKVRNEVTRYKFLQDQKFKLFGKILVHKYHEHYGFDLEWSAWKKKDNGKPYVEGARKFSISHSGDYVCVAFSDLEVGVDIEKIKPLDYNALLVYLHQEEKKFISEALCKLNAFYHVWTRKEAFLKASGKGLIRELDKESCLNNVLYNEKEWNISTLDSIPSYCLAFCSLSQYPQVIFRELNAIDLSIK